MEIIDCARDPHDVERPIRKINEHLQDALFHLQNSNLPTHTKVEIDGLLTEANRVLYEAVRS